MTPAVSAGSNHVGASVMVRANVTRPSGAVGWAEADGATPRGRAATIANASNE